METLLIVSTLLLFSGIGSCRGFLFDDDGDCVVSQWTRWSQTHVFGASGTGTRYRERKILRYPSGEGSACPRELLDTDEVEIETGEQGLITPLPMPITASLMIDHFVRPSKLGYKRNVDTSGMFRDLLLMVDSSGSIGPTNFRTALNELTSLLMVMCPEPDPFNIQYNRAGLLEFATNVTEIFDFDDNPDTAQVMSAIRNAQFFTGGTCTGNAFDYANRMFKTSKGARANDPKKIKPEVLIITDGNSNCGSDAVLAAKRLQSVADVYALVIGSPGSVGLNETSAYVSAPKSKHLFATPNFTDLSSLVIMVLNQLKKHPSQPCAGFIRPG